MPRAFSFRQLVVIRIKGGGADVAERIGCADHVAVRVIFIERAVAEPVSDQLVVAGEIRSIGDGLAAGVRGTDQAAIVVKSVLHCLHAASIDRIGQEMIGAIDKRRALVDAINRLHQVAIAVVLVLKRGAVGIGDLSNPVLASRTKARSSRGTDNAGRIDGERVTVGSVTESPELLIKNVGVAFRSGQLELGKIGKFDLGVNEVYRAGDSGVQEEVCVADWRQSGAAVAEPVEICVNPICGASIGTSCWQCGVLTACNLYTLPSGKVTVRCGS